MIDLDKWGRIGVQRLKDATPKNTGKTAESWIYRIKNKTELVFENTNGKVVLFLTDGHHLSDGTWIKGFDFVTPIISGINIDMRKEEAQDERRKLRRYRLQRTTRR